MIGGLLLDSILALLRNTLVFVETRPGTEASWGSEPFELIAFGGRLEVRTTQLGAARVTVLLASVLLFLRYGYSNLFGSLASQFELRRWRGWCQRQVALGYERSCLLLLSKAIQLGRAKQHLTGTGVAQILFAHALLLEALLIVDARLQSDVGFWLTLIKLTAVYLAMGSLWHLAVTEVNNAGALVRTFVAYKQAVEGVAGVGAASLGDRPAGALIFPAPDAPPRAAAGGAAGAVGGVSHVVFEGLLAILDEDSHWHAAPGGPSSPCPACLSLPCTSKAGHDEVVALSEELRQLEVSVVEKAMGGGGSTALQREARSLRALLNKATRNAAFFFLLWLFNSVAFVGLGLRLVLAYGPPYAKLARYWGGLPTAAELGSMGVACEHGGLALEGALVAAAACLIRRKKRKARGV